LKKKKKSSNLRGEGKGVNKNKFAQWFEFASNYEQFAKARAAN
jgi:hypothetical protein